MRVFGVPCTGVGSWDLLLLPYSPVPTCSTGSARVQTFVQQGRGQRMRAMDHMRRLRTSEQTPTFVHSVCPPCISLLPAGRMVAQVTAHKDCGVVLPCWAARLHNRSLIPPFRSLRVFCRCDLFWGGYLGHALAAWDFAGLTVV